MIPTQDFSIAGLVLHADPVVKFVMLLLVIASIGVWAVVIDRALRLGRLGREARLLDATSRGKGTPPEAGLAASVLAAGRLAGLDRAGQESRAERTTRVREAMRLAFVDGVRPLEPGLPFLATVGSAAPFVGLFGTVWGIMNSFTGIAASNDTSLAVVAPGIAEALFSTAIGLAAAIPAVIAYNRLATSLGRLRALGRSAIARLAEQLGSDGQAAHAATAA